MARDLFSYFRVEARELLDGLTQGILAIERDGLDQGLVARLLRLAHTLKGAARVVKQAEISEAAHRVEDVLSPYRGGEGHLPREETQRLLQLVDRCNQLISGPTSASEKSPNPATVTSEEQIASLRVDVHAVDELLFTIDETCAQLEALGEQSRSLDDLRRLTGRLVERSAAQNGSGRNGKKIASDAAVRSLAAETHATVDRLRGSLRTGVRRIERNLKEIRDQAGSLRLLPVGLIFDALERSVRDAAETQQKQVHFEAVGGEQRLDAHALPKLRDALIHIVRNAVVHGIETETERTAAGKPATGNVRLRVQRSGQRICFQVEDDGRGIDVAAIRRVAVDRRLITVEQARTLGAAEAAQVLFRGGMSTASQVSELSGRGVGLDLVRVAAAQLKGEAGLASEPGRGTTVRISVPVSVESMTVLAAEAGETTALLPFSAVLRVVRVASGDVVHSGTGKNIVVGDQLVPFQPLSTILERNLPFATGDRTWSAVVIKAANRQVAIGVDRILGIRDAVLRPLPDLCGPIPLVTGAALNGAGDPELVYDPASLIASILDNEYPVVTSAPIRPSTVLVVDDSLTTRMLEQSILEAAGYKVDLATSAEEALDKARGAQHSLFLVDVEMPGMNGFELLERFQVDPLLQNTPSIMVTSRASPDDRRRAAQAGAREYIVKSEFDESRLLRTIRELIDEVRR